MKERCLIAMKEKNSVFNAIYCETRGGLKESDSVGDLLPRHYTNKAKIRELLKLGSLHSLGSEIGKAHEQNWGESVGIGMPAEIRANLCKEDPRAQWCCAYGRDLKTPNVGCIQVASLTALRHAAINAQVEYVYVYAYDEWRAWMMVSSGDNARRNNWTAIDLNAVSIAS